MKMGEGLPNRIFHWAHVLDENNKRGQWGREVDAFQRSGEFKVVEDARGDRTLEAPPL